MLLSCYDTTADQYRKIWYYVLNWYDMQLNKIIIRFSLNLNYITWISLVFIVKRKIMFNRNKVGVNNKADVRIQWSPKQEFFHDVRVNLFAKLVF